MQLNIYPALLFLFAPTSAQYDNYTPISIIGAGYSGIYFAWRLVIDLKIVNPEDVAIFEANSQRIGGRTYTVKGIPELNDLVIDIGGYNYERNFEPLRTLIEDKLQFSWFANEPSRRTSAMIRDPYGNNAGFIKPVELMRDQFYQVGGRQIVMGHKLINVLPGPSQDRPIELIFANGVVHYTSKLFLNIPKPSLLSLEANSILFTAIPTSPRVNEAYNFPVDYNTAAVFLVYIDAWWLTKLGHLHGEFDLPGNGMPPLIADYYWGPVKCRDENGNWAPYRIPFTEECTGAIRVYYADHLAPQDELRYYLDLQEDVDEPLMYVYEGHKLDFLLEHNHIQLMIHHRDELLAVGINPEDVDLPVALVLGNWNEYSTMNPSPNVINPSPGIFELVEIMKKPLQNYDVFVMNQAWANQGGIAAPTLNRTDEIIDQYFI